MLFIFSQNIWFIYGVKGLRYLKQFMVIMIFINICHGNQFTIHR
jgi:hypothetical protein